MARRERTTAGARSEGSARQIQGGDSPDRDRDSGFAESDAGMPADPELADLVRRQLELIGEDAGREGLQDTPTRVARSLTWLTKGYRTCVEDVVGTGIFQSEGHHNMVMVRDIELYSLCEHHMLPFFGKAHVAYIPNGYIVGLSKIPRVVDAFARRLQVQERLTVEIRNCIEETLKPVGVAVVIEAQHMCMVMRGIQKQHSIAATSAFTGEFNSEKTRAEFMRLVTSGSHA